MMWSIANLKENLNKIALDVHDDEDDEELAMYNSSHGSDNSISDRRFSHRFSLSKSPTHSPSVNGFDSPYDSEIEQYKAQIKRLQESEAEIKALSVNYAALLKEKEDHISRLNEENGLLKQNLQTTNAALNASRNTLKGSNDQSPNRQNKGIGRNRGLGSPTTNGSVPKQDGLSNGIRGNEKELSDLLEEKNRSLAAIQATHELQMKELQMELEKERGKLANIQLKLQEEQKLKESIQQELKLLKVDKDKASTEMLKIRDDLNQKSAEMSQLQMELHRRGNEMTDDSVESLKRVITTLQRENSHLKSEKNNLEAALKTTQISSVGRTLSGEVELSSKHLNEEKKSSEIFKEQMELSLQKLEKDLLEMRRERDKALQELKRLKQHLLEKASEESEKMDKDSKLIEELREKNDYQRAQILHLEKALKQAIASQEEVKLLNNNEIKKSKQSVNELNRKLASCMRTIEAKNVEILNLQTALGQTIAEIETKERLGEELAIAKKESAGLFELLKNAYQQAETSKREKEELLSKLSQFDRALADRKNRVKKLEEDNKKLSCALEKSMTRLNRMSMDSDYYVDRCIVIKLLVTYFQRNHSNKVLDLMVRMLGFSDENEQRIGLAQQGAGKCVVRGVLGLPGQLVGGILGGSSGNAPPSIASDNKSFADLWVDFLLKETERKKREVSRLLHSRTHVELNLGFKGTSGGSAEAMSTALSSLARVLCHLIPLKSEKKKKVVVGKGTATLVQFIKDRLLSAEVAETDWVLVKLQPYYQVSIKGFGNQKLGRNFFGPFQVEDRISPVAYRLKLPSEAKIHPVFHVSLWKRAVGAENVQDS